MWKNFGNTWEAVAQKNGLAHREICMFATVRKDARVSQKLSIAFECTVKFRKRFDIDRDIGNENFRPSFSIPACAP